MSTQEIVSKILNDLRDRHGELIGGPMLSKTLGFKSLAAMKMSLERETLSIPTFFIPGRRGRFALTTDVAEWLANCRANAAGTNTQDVPANFKKKTGIEK